MRSKKILAIVAMGLISAGGATLLLGGARAEKNRETRLPLPTLSACTSAAHPRLPDRWRGIYLMAPFTTGQLVLSEIVHDGALLATRFSLYGVERGAADFLVMEKNTYLLPSAGTDAKCIDLGDTGWRPLPPDWLNDASRCVGSAPVLKTPSNWWTTPTEPTLSSYWIWSKLADGSPFRLVFSYASDKLAALSRFAMSNQLSFESLERTDLGDIISSCRTAKRVNAGAKRLNNAIDAMAQSTKRADDAIAQLIPALNHRCTAPPSPLWPERLALTGMLTPFDSDLDPAPMEVLYDWSVPAQRSRVFPPNDEAWARDALMLKAGGYNIAQYSKGAATCSAGLPGTLRPNWSERAPCVCRASIAAGTFLTPDDPLQILSCPLNDPIIAWAWYTPSARPVVFMVTSKPGDEGSRSFAVLDYHQWASNLAIAPSTFAKLSKCPDSPVVKVGMPTSAVPNCTTCHAGGGYPGLSYKLSANTSALCPRP